MIHKQMDDDKDGGIEVDESDEVGIRSLHFCIYVVFFFFPPWFDIATHVPVRHCCFS